MILNFMFRFLFETILVLISISFLYKNIESMLIDIKVNLFISLNLYYYSNKSNKQEVDKSKNITYVADVATPRSSWSLANGC